MTAAEFLPGWRYFAGLAGDDDPSLQPAHGEMGRGVPDPDGSGVL